MCLLRIARNPLPCLAFGMACALQVVTNLRCAYIPLLCKGKYSTYGMGLLRKQIYAMQNLYARYGLCLHA